MLQKFVVENNTWWKIGFVNWSQLMSQWINLQHLSVCNHKEIENSFHKLISRTGDTQLKLCNELQEIKVANYHKVWSISTEPQYKFETSATGQQQIQQSRVWLLSRTPSGISWLCLLPRLIWIAFGTGDKVTNEVLDWLWNPTQITLDDILTRNQSTNGAVVQAIDYISHP